VSATLAQKESLSRSVFSDGSYADHFRPDERDNPFRSLYAAKRRDLLEIAGSRPGRQAAGPRRRSRADRGPARPEATP